MLEDVKPSDLLSEEEAVRYEFMGYDKTDVSQHMRDFPYTVSIIYDPALLEDTENWIESNTKCSWFGTEGDGPSECDFTEAPRHHLQKYRHFWFKHHHHAVEFKLTFG